MNRWINGWIFNSFWLASNMDWPKKGIHLQVCMCMCALKHSENTAPQKHYWLRRVCLCATKVQVKPR